MRTAASSTAKTPHQVVYTSHHAKPHWKFEGCRHISFYSVGY